MTVISPSLSPSRRVGAPPPAARRLAVAAPAKSPAGPAQAALGTPPKFKDLEAFKQYVESSPVTALPAATERLRLATSRLEGAQRAHEARTAALGLPGAISAVEARKQALEAALFPMRPRAAELHAEADVVRKKAAEIEKRIARLQHDIAKSEGIDTTRDWAATPDDEYDGWDLIGDIADHVALKNAKKEVYRLIDEKVALEGQVGRLVAQATAYESQPGEPQAIAGARRELEAAEGLVAGLKAQLAPEARALSAAQAEHGAAAQAHGELAGLRDQLKDYGSRFGTFTRLKLFFSDRGWKKDLDAFFKAKGL